MLWFWRDSQVAQWFAPLVLHFIFLGLSEVELSHSWFLTLKILCSIGVGGQLSFQFKVELFYFEISCRDSGLSLYSWIERKPHWPVHGVLGQFCLMWFEIWLWLLLRKGSSSETFLYVARYMDETRRFSLASCHGALRTCSCSDGGLPTSFSLFL